MANFRLEDRPGFPGRFAVVAETGVTPTGEQDSFIGRIDAMMARYEAMGETSAPTWPLRDTARQRNLSELRQTATDFVAGALAADRAILMTYVIQGHWEAALGQIDARPFVVQALDVNGRQIPLGSETRVFDLGIIVKDRPIPQDKLHFKVDIDRTLTVIKVILPAGQSDQGRIVPENGTAAHHTASPPPSGFGAFIAATWHWVSNLTAIRHAFGLRSYIVTDTMRRRSNYIKQLVGIARVGLESTDPSLTTLATQSLDSLREEIVGTEAGRVKNRYLWRLGFRCFIAAAISVFIYWTISENCPIKYEDGLSFRLCSNIALPSVFRNFFLLSAGTAVGTWLSFSLRRVILTFLDLASLEEDRLDPTIRVLFITALANVVGLLFWTKAVTVGIGDFQSQFSTHGTYALLIGLLLGIAERTMSSAVSKRAADFAGAIGGK